MRKFFVLHIILGGLLLGVPLTSLKAQPKKYSSYGSSSNRAKVSSNNSINKKLEEAERIYSTDAKKALNLVETALLKSIKSDYVAGQARSNKLLADINFSLEEYRLAYANYKKAYDLYVRLGSAANQYYILPRIGRSAEEYGLLAESLKYYELYLKEAKKRNHKVKEVEAQNGMARIYEKQGKLEKSETQLKQALTQSTQINNKRQALNSNKQLGKIKEKQKKTDEAINYYQQSQDLAYELNDPSEINISYTNISNAYRGGNDLDNSLKIQEQAARFNERNGNVANWMGNNIDAANTLIDQNENPKAIEKLEQNYLLAEANSDLGAKVKTVEALSRAYKKEGQTTKAEQLYKDYLVLEDSLNKIKNEEQMDKDLQNQVLENIQNKMLVLEKDKELDVKTIELLQNEKILREEQIRIQKWISYSLGFIILMLMVGSYLVYKSIRQKRIANQLLTLKSLRSQMNPHFIFNALNSVNNFISMSDERAANKYLSDFSRLMREVMQNSQEDFIPLASEVGILGLYIKLEHFRFKNKFDYTFDVDEDINQEEFYIPPMLIQPYIENAVWHGLRYKEEMGFLSVKMFQEADQLMVEITDNGIGRKKSGELKTKNQKSLKSTGMKNIDNRMKILNDVYKAKLHVAITDLDEINGAGTKVTIRIPSQKMSQPPAI